MGGHPPREENYGVVFNANFVPFFKCCLKTPCCRVSYLKEDRPTLLSVPFATQRTVLAGAFRDFETASRGSRVSRNIAYHHDFFWKFAAIADGIPEDQARVRDPARQGGARL